MDNKDKWDLFKEELALIKNETIKQFALNGIAILPDYFFEMPASTTGKYHPSYALGKGGLLRHTKAMVGIIIMLVGMEMWSMGLSSDDIDLAIASAILHDGWKKGDATTKWTTKDHPLFAVRELKKDDIASKILPDEQFKIVCGCMESHMGQHWSPEDAFLPKPATKLEKLVHQADYLASRKNLEYNFDVPITRR